jgi:hypothetical protein
MAAAEAFSPSAMTTDAWPVLPKPQTLQRQRSNRTRFFTHGYERIAPDTHQDQANGDQAAGRPGGLLPPQKNVGAASCPMDSSQTCGCRRVGANPWVAHVAGDPLVLPTGDGDPASHSDQMAVAPFPQAGLAGRRRHSCEAARHVKRLALLQYVVGRPG